MTEGRSGLRLQVVLLLGVFAAAVAGVCLGEKSISLGDTARVVLAALGLGDDSVVAPENRDILWFARLPRVCILLLVGGALSVAGTTLQAAFQNPLADPGILGVSSGGALGAVMAIYLGAAAQVQLVVSLAAFLGAFLTSMLVYAIAHLGSRPSTTSLLLTGIAMGSLTGAGVSLVLLHTEEYRLPQILFWLLGGAEGRTWLQVLAALPLVVLGVVLLCLRHRHLDALALGEEHALSVGLPVVRARLSLLTLAALVAGVAVSVTGPISFVGLIVPHLLRFLVGPAARALLPAAFLGGAAFLVLCDLAARVLSRTTEVHLGVLMAFLGVPWFLWLLQRSRRMA